MEMNFYRADVSTSLTLQYADGGIRAGFPSPAQDYVTDSIDLNRELIQHPASTFYARVSGDSMIGEGIYEGDILVIDRAENAVHGDLAVCCFDGEFMLRRLRFLDDGRLLLMASNAAYPPVEVALDADFSVWGVVTYTIKANRRLQRDMRRW